MKLYKSLLKFHKQSFSILLNVIGLMIAYITFIIIMMQVKFDNEYDKCHKDYDCIYKLEIVHNDSTTSQYISLPLYNFIAESGGEHVLKITAYNDRYDEIIYGANNQFAWFSANEVEQNFIDIFNFNIVNGSESLSHDNIVLIPESMAMKYWKTNNIIGDTLQNDSKRIIGGVYKDFPENSSIRNIIYTKLVPRNFEHSWNVWNYNVFLKLDNSNSADIVLESYNKELKKISKDLQASGISIMELRLVSISELHFHSIEGEKNSTKTTHESVLLLIIISIIIVLIAGFNFANYNIATIPMRVKNVNIKRIHGVDIWKLRFSLLSKSTMISVYAWGLSIIGVIMCKNTFIHTLIHPDISIIDNLPIVVLSFIIAVILGVISGLYSTIYLTTKPIRFALKNHFGISRRGKILRGTLLSIQYVASFTLIICSMYINSSLNIQLTLMPQSLQI